MEMVNLLLLAIVVFFIMSNFLEKKSSSREFIQNYCFPDKVSVMLREKYAHLTDEEIADVLVALKQYFLISRERGNDMVSMPSKVVDVAWHEFILFTRDYEKFCRQAFGQFLHHTPAEAMESNKVMDEGMRRAWRWLAILEELDPANPARLPLLFAIDQRLNIPDGNFYEIHPTKKGYRRIGEHQGVSGGSKNLNCG